MNKCYERKTMTWVYKEDPRFPLKAKLEDPQTVTVSHDHEFNECIFVIAGRGMHQSEKNPPVPVRRGDVLFIPVGGHHSYTESDDLAVCNLLFHAMRLPSVLLELYSKPAYKHIFLKKFAPEESQDFPIIHLEEPVFSELENMLRYMAAHDTEQGDRCYKLGLFMAILSRLCQEWKIGTDDEPAVPLDIPKLTAYLEQNFQRSIYLDDLTKLAGMSRSTLLRHFQAAFGVPPMIYLRNLRLRHSAELLLKTELTLTEVAEQSGFSQMSYFFRAFKECYGVPPQEYRNQK